MWKKDLDHCVHDGQRVIHDQLDELLSTHSSVYNMRSTIRVS